MQVTTCKRLKPVVKFKPLRIGITLDRKIPHINLKVQWNSERCHPKAKLIIRKRGHSLETKTKGFSCNPSIQQQILDNSQMNRRFEATDTVLKKEASNTRDETCG